MVLDWLGDCWYGLHNHRYTKMQIHNTQDAKKCKGTTYIISHFVVSQCVFKSAWLVDIYPWMLWKVEESDECFFRVNAAYNQAERDYGNLNPSEACNPLCCNHLQNMSLPFLSI